MTRPWWTYSLFVGIALSILAELQYRARSERADAPATVRRLSAQPRSHAETRDIPTVSGHESDAGQPFNQTDLTLLIAVGMEVVPVEMRKTESTLHMPVPDPRRTRIRWSPTERAQLEGRRWVRTWRWQRACHAVRHHRRCAQRPAWSSSMTSVAFSVCPLLRPDPVALTGA
jgi:hypothetical protein